jgi:predicted Fe-Mo cluster-binding NifX family protein
VDTANDGYEAIPNPGRTGQRGAGVEIVVLVISRGVDVLVTRYCKPSLCNQLKANGIDVLTDIDGTAASALEYCRNKYPDPSETMKKGPGKTAKKDVFFDAVRSSLRQFLVLLPSITGVVLLMGLFNGFVSREILSSIFSGSILSDTLRGAFFGSIFAGNAINSYVIGGELLQYGISLFAVTAFIISWVTVGLVQLPAEAAALGGKFALLRNGLSFIMALVIAILTVAMTHLFGG